MISVLSTLALFLFFKKCEFSAAAAAKLLQSFY